MGFDTVVAAIMVTLVVIATAYVFLSGSSTIAEVSIESYKKAVDEAKKRLQSDIEILNVLYNNGTLSAVIKNSGEEKYLSFKEFDAFIYGRTEMDEFFSSYLHCNYSIVEELINPEIFDPKEVAFAEAEIVLENGSYVLLVCSPNAICSSFSFNVR